MSNNANGSATTGGVSSSLEDCLTNVFQITDLNGLKWCCLTAGVSSSSFQQEANDGANLSQPQPSSSDNLPEHQDQVLHAYTECLENNVLCTWRRRPPQAGVQTAYEKPIPQPNAPKELWIFWYTADEPKLIEQFQSRGMNVLTHSESGDADAPRVEFEYETRTLFFRALNNAIERRLLAMKFVRFGHWFCRPLELSLVGSDNRKTIPRFTNGIRLHYFLHRESICGTIVTQRQPTILRLNRSHLEEETEQRAQRIILGPHSIRAQLVSDQKAILQSEDNRRKAQASTCIKREVDEQSSLLDSSAQSIPGPSLFSISSTTPAAKLPSQEQQQTTAETENADDGLREQLDWHWNKWKRIYPGLEEINSTVSNKMPPNCQNRRSSGGGNKGIVNNSSSNDNLLPRMVLVELHGQQMLWPSAFVGIVADELLPAQKQPQKTFLRKCSDNLLEAFTATPVTAQVDSFDQEGSDLPCSSSEKETVVRMRRRDWAGLCAARTSFGNGCLRCQKHGEMRNRPATATTEVNTIAEPALIEQQQRPADWMGELDYDYMRREFCYCPICSRGNTGLQQTQQETPNSSQQQQSLGITSEPNPTMNPSLQQQNLQPQSCTEPKAFHRLDCKTSNNTDEKSQQQHCEILRHSWRFSQAKKLGNCKMANGGDGSSNSKSKSTNYADQSTTSASNNSKWVKGHASTSANTASTLSKERQQTPHQQPQLSATITELKQWNIYHLIGDGSRRRIMEYQQQHMAANNIVPNNGFTQEQEAMDTSHSQSFSMFTDEQVHFEQQPCFSQPMAGTSELERMIMGDDDDDDVITIEQKTLNSSTQEDPMGLLRKRRNNDNKRSKYKKRKSPWKICGTSIKRQRMERPDLSNLDILSIAFNEEDSSLFSVDPCAILPQMFVDNNNRIEDATQQFASMDGNGTTCEQKATTQEPTLLMRLLLSPNAAATVIDGDAGSTPHEQQQQIIMETNSDEMQQPQIMAAVATPAAAAAITTTIEERLDEYAVTPPAYADTETLILVHQQQSDQTMQMETTNYIEETPMHEATNTTNSPSIVDMASPSSLLQNQQQFMQHQQPSTLPHHILSPPASNERIDCAVATTLNLQQQQQQPLAQQHLLHSGPSSVGTSTQHQMISTTTAALAANAALLQESLSRIYPTPPTPMQQFSPQNLLLLHHSQHLLSQQHAPQPTIMTEQSLLTTIAYFTEHLRHLSWEEPLYGAGTTTTTGTNFASHQQKHARLFAWQLLCNTGMFAGGDESDVAKELATDLSQNSCSDCLTMKNPYSDEHQGQYRHTKRYKTCCEHLLEKVAPPTKTVSAISFNRTFPPQPIANQLHAVAHRRTQADTNLERMLRQAEQQRLLRMDQQQQHQNQMLQQQPQWPLLAQQQPHQPYWTTGQFPPALIAAATQQHQQQQQQQMPNFPMAAPIQQQRFGLPLPPNAVYPTAFPPFVPSSNSAAMPLPMFSSVGGNTLTQQQLSRTQQHSIPGSVAQLQRTCSSVISSLCTATVASTPPLPPLGPSQLSRAMSQQQMFSLAGLTRNSPASSSASPLQQQQQQRETTPKTTCVQPIPFTNHQQQLNMATKMAQTALISLLVQDTIVDLHYDIMFDSCPLCCCNSNIRSFELGFYITAPIQLLTRSDQLRKLQQQSNPLALASKQWSGFRIPTVSTDLQKCICGFSAVRHRYLCSLGSGLFPEDIAEAGGYLYGALAIKQTKGSMPCAGHLFLQFNATSAANCHFVDLLRHLNISRDLAATIRSSRFPILPTSSNYQKQQNEEYNFNNNEGTNNNNSDYVHSPVDSIEFGRVVNAILNICGVNVTDDGGEEELSKMQSTLHPWGYQIADAVGEPRDAECLGVFDEIRDTLREPGAQPLLPSYSIVGSGSNSNSRCRQHFEQLTLRNFARTSKNSSGTSAAAIKDGENGRPEPIPQVMAMSAAERMPVLLSPAVVQRHWEQIELMPIDQPKDVLYVVLVPNVKVIAEKCKTFMEELSSMYERRCRLGAHIRLGTKDTPRDAIFRVCCIPTSTTTANNSPMHSLHELLAQFQNGEQQKMQQQNIGKAHFAIQRLTNYAERCVQELMNFFAANDSVFERRTYLESVAVFSKTTPPHQCCHGQRCPTEQQHNLASSLAIPSDFSAMPPPAMPGGIGSMLYTTNGPASATARVASSIAAGANIGGPGSASASSANQNPSPLSIPGHQNQQQSPTGASGPNSVPILHGNPNDVVPQTTMAANINAGGFTSLTAEELAKQEAQQAREMREQVEILLAKEPPQLPHTIVVYMVNPFGQQLGSSSSNEYSEMQPNSTMETAVDDDQFEALATAALLMAWNDFFYAMPPKYRPQLQVELLPLRAIYDCTAFMGMGQGQQPPWEVGGGGRERTSAWDALKRLAFGVYTQPRIIRPNVALSTLPKSMTRFGAAERMRDIIQAIEGSQLLFKHNCTPFMLAPARTVNLLLSSQLPGGTSTSSNSHYGNAGSSLASLSAHHKLQLLNPDERVLFLAYHLLPGDDWLCAAVTDERGALLDTALINLALPPNAMLPADPNKEWRHKQRHSQIADALHRLWIFAQSVMLGQAVHQWRLVVNRMGKIGHGEFKLWNELLSKKSLRAYNASLKNRGGTSSGAADISQDGLATTSSSTTTCSACTKSQGLDTPVLLSACLISTEPEPHLRVFGSPSAGTLSDGLGMEGSAMGGSNIGAIGGLSAGAMMASGAGAATKLVGTNAKSTGRQSAGGQQQQMWLNIAPDDRSLTHIVVFPTILNAPCQEDMLQTGIDDDGFPEFFNYDDAAMDGMDGMIDNLISEATCNEEEAPIDNQPMAIGFTISTAPVWPWPHSSASSSTLVDPDIDLVNSFWSNCPPAARHRRLAHLKSSLHINATNLLQSDEYQTSKTGGTAPAATANATNGTSAGSAQSDQQFVPHPLDLANTDEILRYVLETQNALSWLNLDPITGARCSCLPIHMQALLRLARSVGMFYGRSSSNAIGIGTTTNYSTVTTTTTTTSVHKTC